MGSVLTARSDLKAPHSEGSMPMLGDFLVVVTCFTAALYMAPWMKVVAPCMDSACDLSVAAWATVQVCFKMMFAKDCSTSLLEECAEAGFHYRLKLGMYIESTNATDFPLGNRKSALPLLELFLCLLPRTVFKILQLLLLA